MTNSRIQILERIRYEKSLEVPDNQFIRSRPHGLSHEEVAHHVATYLDHHGLADDFKNYANQKTGGQTIGQETSVHDMIEPLKRYSTEKMGFVKGGGIWGPLVWLSNYVTEKNMSSHFRQSFPRIVTGSVSAVKK